jgi:pimeloyl-ACP methyl ester carboxylesterase
MDTTLTRLIRLSCCLLLAAGLGGCAIAPVGLVRTHQPDVADADGLPVLLEHALAARGSEAGDHALAHFIESWHENWPARNAGSIRGAHGTAYQVRFETCCSGSYLPAYFDRIQPTSDFRVARLEHHRRDGVGVPMVAIRENQGREPIETFYPPEAITRPLTAVLDRPAQREVRIRLMCPLTHDRVEVAGRAAPLAADFTVPWAVLLARTGPLRASAVKSVLGDTPAREPRLFLMEPYHPAKRPLIMIHGLFSTPLAWAQLSNDLWADDEFRRHYQIWHFLYDTSAPALYAGRVLQAQLRELRPRLDPTGGDPAMQATTVVAHSMGGLVTRRLVTRPGDAFWKVAFTRPLDQLELEPADREQLREAFFWDSERHVRRVIFVAVPHRGSDFADNFLGRLGISLARPPARFRAFYQRVSSANPGAFTPAYAQLGAGELDSIHALSPRQPTLAILASLPPAHPVVMHSIIGDRGRPGPPESSSDGVVDYWSSHLAEAESERIVPAGHSAFEHPEAVAEIRRILRLDGAPAGGRGPRCRPVVE